jgi:ribonucleoside-diphosphate reductase alpha chain
MALSNNSVVYTDKPDSETFLREWTSLVESKSGERGIFNRVSAQKQAESTGRRDPNYDFGTNPCSEIILRPHQFCNLTEVVVRNEDKDEDLIRKVKIATILGTAQSTLTKFPYLRKIWQYNTQEERLLGVSLTGIMDNILTNGKLVDMDKRLTNLKQVAIDTNREYAEKFGIQPSTAITCVKPSGTVSQLCDSASGIHARHSEYYIRTVRGDNKDPLTKFMIDQGVESEPCVMKPDTTTVFSFPMKSPKGSRMRDDMSALEQLRVWMMYQEWWCEHKPSITVTVKEDEWFDVGAFVFKNFDKMSGVSFLPHSDHVYQQAPYQECTEEEYNDMISNTTTRIDWSKLKDFEKGDTTSGSQTMACSGDSCEIVDIGA